MENKTHHNNPSDYILAGLFVMLELGNIVLMESSLNLLITIPEALYVLYILFKQGNIRRALLLHVAFCLTGFDATATDSEMQLYSYPEAKLVGPLTLSYVILGLIWTQSLKLPIRSYVKNTLIYRFRKTILIIMAYGFGVGFIGLMLFQYRFNDFITPFVYICVGFVFLDVIVKLYDYDFLKKCYQYSFCLIVASPLATFISFFLLNVRTTYSIYDSLISNEIFGFCPALLLFLIMKDKCNKTLLWIGLITFFACIFVAGRGAAFYDLAGCFFIIALLVYSKSPVIRPIYSKILTIGLPLGLIALVSYSHIMELGDSLGTRKLSELFSMFEALGSVSTAGMDITGISESPYVRIAEALNILDNGLNNIFGLLFGYGYGGFFTDSTHLFQNATLLDAYPQEYINTGRYGAAHSFLPTILLYNGVIGFILIAHLGVSYLKKTKYTPLAFVSFSLFFHGFYFNTLAILAAAFILFAAEYKIEYNSVTKS